MIAKKDETIRSMKTHSENAKGTITAVGPIREEKDIHGLSGQVGLVLRDPDRKIYDSITRDDLKGRRVFIRAVAQRD